MPNTHSVLRKITDIAFLTRPGLLCASCTFFFAGAAASMPSWKTLYGFQSIARLLPNLALFVLVAAVAFVVNQVFDIESDTVNRKNYILPSGAVTVPESLVFTGCMAVITIVLSLQRSSTVRYLTWIGLGLAFCYSVRPMRLKGRPLADLAANVAGFGFLAFALGWLVFADFGAGLIVRSLPYMVAMGAIFLNTCIPDETGDKAAGDRTSCVVYGARAVSKMALLLLLAAGGLGAIAGEPISLMAAVGSVPVFIATSAEPTPERSVIASQFAARLLFLLVCARSPLLAGMGLLAYLGSKAYYRRRFGLDYPNIRGAQ
jgi:chlorophyll synthase